MKKDLERMQFVSNFFASMSMLNLVIWIIVDNIFKNANIHTVQSILVEITLAGSLMIFVYLMLVSEEIIREMR